MACAFLKLALIGAPVLSLLSSMEATAYFPDASILPGSIIFSKSTGSSMQVSVDFPKGTTGVSKWNIQLYPSINGSCTNLGGVLTGGDLNAKFGALQSSGTSADSANSLTFDAPAGIAGRSVLITFTSGAVQCATILWRGPVVLESVSWLNTSNPTFYGVPLQGVFYVMQPQSSTHDYPMTIYINIAYSNTTVNLPTTNNWWHIHRRGPLGGDNQYHCQNPDNAYLGMELGGLSCATNKSDCPMGDLTNVYGPRNIPSSFFAVDDRLSLNVVFDSVPGNPLVIHNPGGSGIMSCVLISTADVVWTPYLTPTGGNPTSAPKASSKAGPIAGGVIGGLVGVAVIGGAAFMCHSKGMCQRSPKQPKQQKQQQQQQQSNENGSSSAHGGQKNESKGRQTSPPPPNPPNSQPPDVLLTPTAPQAHVKGAVRGEDGIWRTID